MVDVGDDREVTDALLRGYPGEERFGERRRGPAADGDDGGREEESGEGEERGRQGREVAPAGCGCTRRCPAAIPSADTGRTGG